MKVVYVTYDGLLEPLGQAQVVPYAEGLVSRGVVLSVVSFEKPVDLARIDRHDALRQRLARGGMGWKPLRYHRRPSVLVTAFDIVRGAIAVATLIQRGGAEIVHARSYVPAVMGWLATRVARARIVFDMRGFWVDERVEAGLWPRDGWLFRAGKRWERRLLRRADGIIVLAAAATKHLEALAGEPIRKPVAVVPTCVDLERFFPRNKRVVRERLNLPAEAFVLLYAGSLGTWYLGPETFALADAVASRVKSFFLVILTREQTRATALLPAALGDRTRILTVAHEEVPEWMAAADAGLALVRPTFSKVASCPTKVGEYLASGLPVVSTDRVGDVSQILDEGAGVVVSEWTESALRVAAARIVALAGEPEVAERCRSVAAAHFSLRSGVDSLQAMYGNLVDRTRGRSA